jgi:hypothetical protein
MVLEQQTGRQTDRQTVIMLEQQAGRQTDRQIGMVLEQTDRHGAGAVAESLHIETTAVRQSANWACLVETWNFKAHLWAIQTTTPCI